MSVVFLVQQRGEESSRTFASLVRVEDPAGFFAPLRTTDAG
jgi:hypothetical protein